MMKSPNFIATAVRKPDGKIILQYHPYNSILKKVPFLKKPFIRGVAGLIESMAQGMRALSFSAEIAGIEESPKEGSKKELSKSAIAGSMFLAFAVGMGMFVALPHVATVLITSDQYLGITPNSPIFHLIAGAFKILILLTYLAIISQFKDVYRVFQYHGAEHKAIFAFEAGLPLTVESTKRFRTLHPRCGTSFLFFLVFVSVVIFSIVLPAFGLTALTSNAVMNNVLMILIKILLMPVVAGVAYEVIKLSAKHMDHPFFKIIIWPGLMLQKITTKEPLDDQVEVALASLRQCLRLEKGLTTPDSQFEVGSFGEIPDTHSALNEFLEG
jgi:uncharacterized protein YqhQ